MPYSNQAVVEEPFGLTLPFKVAELDEIAVALDELAVGIAEVEVAIMLTSSMRNTVMVASSVTP